MSPPVSQNRHGHTQETRLDALFLDRCQTRNSWPKVWPGVYRLRNRENARAPVFIHQSDMSAEIKQTFCSPSSEIIDLLLPFVFVIFPCDETYPISEKNTSWARYIRFFFAQLWRKPDERLAKTSLVSVTFCFGRHFRKFQFEISIFPYLIYRHWALIGPWAQFRNSFSCLRPVFKAFKMARKFVPSLVWHFLAKNEVQTTV